MEKKSSWNILRVLTTNACNYRCIYCHNEGQVEKNNEKIDLDNFIRIYKIAERIAEKEGALALVTGESLGQVASQTLENIRATDAAVSLPVYRPFIGTDKLEIINLAQSLGTFEISSQDAPDCCTLFMPRSPETHAKLKDVLAAEALLPIEDWISEIMQNLEYKLYDCPSYKARH